MDEYGEDGNDMLRGEGGDRDKLYGGPGNDGCAPKEESGRGVIESCERTISKY